ncbi:MAG: glycolate oxidase subunit GlcE [Burkholderiales bacterium]|nr:glycolate oxidase subunit GlcE [Burkholderiales bacterium]
MADLAENTNQQWRQWADQIRAAAADSRRIRVRGGGSKDFLGDTLQGDIILETRAWSGVEAYEPTELIVRARAGTPLSEVEALLASKGQYFPFEPPRYGWASEAGATRGGVVAAGLSGPGRVSRGAVRDHVLGCTLMNGRGEVLRFGGSVMKNVAGFDLSRLMAGSMGTLGVLLDVTLKVMPQPVSTATMRIEMTEADALVQVNQWAAQPIPLDASAWWDGMLVLRLRGARAAVASSVQRLYRERGGELIAPPLADGFWQGVRDHSDEFFVRARQAVAKGGGHGVTLWRVSVPPTAAPLGLPGEQLNEWFGAQRWVCTAAPADAVHDVAAKAGGHAQPFVSTQVRPLTDASEMAPVLRRLHERVQQAFDPDGVFATGRKWSMAEPALLS